MMFFVMSQAWDKESPYEESNFRSSDSALRCSTTERLHSERGPLRSSSKTCCLRTVRISDVTCVTFVNGIRETVMKTRRTRVMYEPPDGPHSLQSFCGSVVGHRRSEVRFLEGTLFPFVSHSWKDEKTSFSMDLVFNKLLQTCIFP